MTRQIILEAVVFLVGATGCICLLTVQHWPRCRNEVVGVNHWLIIGCCVALSVASVIGAIAVIKPSGYQESYCTFLVAAIVSVLHVGTFVYLCWDPNELSEQWHYPTVKKECHTLLNASTVLKFSFTVLGLMASVAIAFKHYRLWDRYVSSNASEVLHLPNNFCPICVLCIPFMIILQAIRERPDDAPAGDDLEQPDSSGSAVKQLALKKRHDAMLKYTAFRTITPGNAVAVPAGPLTILDLRKSQRNKKSPQQCRRSPVDLATSPLDRSTSPQDNPQSPQGRHGSQKCLQSLDIEKM